MKIKMTLFFILLSAVNSWADESQKQENLAETRAESEKMALHKRCEKDPDWCEKRKNLKNGDDANDVNCENFACDKPQDIQDIKVIKQTPQATEEKWCIDNPEICEQLKTHTEKLRDLQRQIDELHQAFGDLNKTNSEQTLDESQKIETSATDQ